MGAKGRQIKEIELPDHHEIIDETENTVTVSHKTHDNDTVHVKKCFFCGEEMNFGGGHSWSNHWRYHCPYNPKFDNNKTHPMLVK